MPQSDTSGRAALKSGTAQKLSAGLCLVHCFPKPSRHIGYHHTFKQTTKQEQSFLFISTTPKHDYIPQPTAQSSPWWTIPKYYQLQIVLQEQSGVEDNGRAECIDMHPEITPPALFGAKNVLLSHLLFSNSCCTSCLTRRALAMPSSTDSMPCLCQWNVITTPPGSYQNMLICKGFKELSLLTDETKNVLN